MLLTTLKESLCETFIGEQYDIPEHMPLPHIDSHGLANLLTTLPPKVVCDALLQSFLIGVHPIYPLVHLPTITKDYNNFWQWCRNSDISQPDNTLLGDPTFFNLLFSILLCGAAASSAAMWTAGGLKGMKKESIIDQLKEIYSASLIMCQHLQYPTLSTLASSLFAHTWLKPDVPRLEHLRFISSIVGIAQSMGLHRECSLFGLDAVTCEMRRRIWWHIVWLDVQTSILHGSQSCLSSNEIQNNIKMVSETRDEDLSRTAKGLLTRAFAPSSGVASIAMLLAIGRFETARFKHFLISNPDGKQSLRQARAEELENNAEMLLRKLGKLIERIPVLEVSETGFVPSRLANATPLTHELLYSDHTNQPTIWSSWARIILIMLKIEVAISVRKPFLGRADNQTKQDQEKWDK